MKNYFEIFSSIADSMDIDIVTFNRVGNDIIEVIIAYKDNSDHVDLDTCAEVANAFAEAVDFEIALDVSSEGAEREIDLEEIESVLNEYVFVKFKNPKAGFDQVEGDLISIDENSIEVKYRFKHTHKTLMVERDNIDLLRLAVKI